MSIEAIAPVVPVLPDIGRRIPAVLPEDLRIALGRLLMYVKPADVKAMLAALADRYAVAEKRRESFEASILVRAHAGEHKEFRWDESRRLGP